MGGGYQLVAGAGPGDVGGDAVEVLLGLVEAVLEVDGGGGHGFSLVRVVVGVT